jgi:hypothetical protein
MEAGHPVVDRDLRGPAGGVGEGPGVGHVPALVADAPGPEAQRRTAPLEGGDGVDELEQAHGAGGATADVERPTAKPVDAAHGQLHGVEQVVDEQDVANLAAVAVHGDGLTGHGPHEEVGDPTLVLVALLVRAVDAAHAEHQGGQAEAPGVVEHVLVGASLGASVRAAELQGTSLADPVVPPGPVPRFVALTPFVDLDVVETAVHLVGRGEQQRGPLVEPAKLLEEGDGAGQVHIEIVERLGHARRDRHLGGEVKDPVDPDESPSQGRAVAHIALVHLQAAGMGVGQPTHVLGHSPAGQVVEHHHVVPGPKEAVSQVGADEPGPPGDEGARRPTLIPHGPARWLLGNGHTVSPRARSSEVAASTWSTATWPPSHPASSVIPLSRSTSGR